MHDFRVGDLIANFIPEEDITLKIGIVVENQPENILVKWLNYNKSFFMEKEDVIFAELNNTFLLSLQSIHKHNSGVFLRLLSPS